MSHAHKMAAREEELPRRIVAIVICSLSVIGSLFIILSFCFVRKLRGKLRSILVFISLMDIFYSAANIFGAGVNFKQYFNHSTYSLDASFTIKNLCIAQGIFAQYGTLGSIFWTVALSLYLYLSVVQYLRGRTEMVLKLAYYGSHFVCWIIPLYTTVWSLAEGRLTFSPLESFGGWCSVKGDVRHGQPVWSSMKFVDMIWMNMWIILAYILILIFCLAAFGLILHEVYIFVDCTFDSASLGLYPSAFFVLHVCTLILIIIIMKYQF